MANIDNLNDIKEVLIKIKGFNMTVVSSSMTTEKGENIIEYEENTEIFNDLFIKAINNKSNVIRKEMLKILKEEHKEEFKTMHNIEKIGCFRDAYKKFIK